MEAQETNTDLKGHVIIDMYDGDPEYDADGAIISVPIKHWEGYNRIVTTGKQEILDMLFGLSGQTKITSCGVGDDSTADALTDTKLNPGVAGNVQINNFDATPTRAALVVTTVTTFPANSGASAANFNWREVALFNGTTNGTSNMLSRIAPIGAFNKTSTVAIVVTYTITQA